MASIQKISRAKGAVYKVTIRQTGNGTICKTFPTKKMAVEFARKVEGNDELALALGNPIAMKLNLSDIITEYLELYTGKDHGLYGCLAWWSKQYGHLPLNKINAVTIREGIKLLSNGNTLRGNGLGQTKEMNRKRSGSTVNRYKDNLSSVFEFSKEEYGLTENPCRDVKSKPEGKGRTRFLTDDERSRLLIACRESKWDMLYLLVLMALTTGARKSELLGLSYQDIDINNGYAHLWETKNGEQRLLPLTDEVSGLIFPQVAESYNIINTNTHKGLIFPSEQKPQQGFEFRKHWVEALKKAEIKGFRFHDLRHSAASYLAKNGASLKEIADVLGHKDLQSTNRYSHLCIGYKKKLISRVMGGIV